jgi:hypothetical protein
LGASLAVLVFKMNHPVLWSKLFLAAGVGALGFSFFRLIFVQLYRDRLAWFSFWEEITELIFVAGAALILWVFRRGLFAAGAKDGQRATASSIESHHGLDEPRYGTSATTR